MCPKGSDHEGAYPTETPLPGMLRGEINTHTHRAPAARGRELGKYSAGNSMMASTTADASLTTG